MMFMFRSGVLGIRGVVVELLALDVVKAKALISSVHLTRTGISISYLKAILREIAEHDEESKKGFKYTDISLKEISLKAVII
jgi:hypothetical protein